MVRRCAWNELTEARKQTTGDYISGCAQGAQPWVMNLIFPRKSRVQFRVGVRVVGWKRWRIQAVNFSLHCLPYWRVGDVHLIGKLRPPERERHRRTWCRGDIAFVDPNHAGNRGGCFT